MSSDIRARMYGKGPTGEALPFAVTAAGGVPVEADNATLGFSTFALLANGVAYDSTILDLREYTQVQTHILSDVDGTIVIDFCRDAAGTDVLRSLTIPYTGGSGFQAFSAPAFTPYVRYRFTANEIGQADFYFDTKFLRVPLSAQVLGATAFISTSMTAALMRSIVVGQDDDGTFRNVATTRDGGLHVSLTDSDLGFHAEVTPGGGLKTAEQTHLAGAAFGGAVLASDKWNVTLAGSGSQDASGAGELTMDTGVTADSAVKIDSSDVARFLPANYNTSHHAITIPDGAAYAANNVREWGAFDATSGTCNGVYWKLDGGAWSVAHCVGGVETAIAIANWNGAAKDTFPLASITANVYETEYNAGSIIYRCNGGVMHRENLLAAPFVNSVDLPVGMLNTNKNGSTTAVSMKIRAAGIYTLGKGRGVDRPSYISGTTAGQLMKTGAGHLGRVIFARNGAGGGDATISIYDGITAVNQIGRIAIDRDDTLTVPYDLTFNTGLYVVVAGAGTLGTTIVFD